MDIEDIAAQLKACSEILYAISVDSRDYGTSLCMLSGSLEKYAEELYEHEGMGRREQAVPVVEEVPGGNGAIH